MDNPLLTALALIPALVIAIVFHEVAHGWAALALGDPTAKERRRLTFNPIRHVDPIGTVILPGALALSGLPVFGWAKPVPVNKQRLRNPRFGMIAVAAAGPGTNLLLATLGAVLLSVAVQLLWPGAGEAREIFRMLGDGYSPVVTSPAGFTVFALYFFIMINVFLALFNLLPIPPFDGSHVVEGLLPRRAAQIYVKLRPFGFGLMILLLLVIPWFFPQLRLVERVILPPVLWTENLFLSLAAWIAGG